MGVKCLVTDLDDTLWDGKLVEFGVDGVHPHYDRITVLRELDSRGILLSIASRNSHELAMNALSKFGITDLFLAPQINFGPKYTSLELIAKTLSLGINSFAFVDNEETELEEMRRRFPDILGIRAEDYLKIPSMTQFEGGSTRESRNRRKLYQSMLQERGIQIAKRLSPDSFLPDLETIVDINIAEREDLKRIHELIERTHQLNFSGNNYSMASLEKIYLDTNKAVYVVNVKNDITDYGRSGVCLVDKQMQSQWIIRDLLFSCRVAGKGVEMAAVSYLLQEARNQGVDTLIIDYRQTEFNSHLPLIIGSFDFEEEKYAHGHIKYKLNTSQAIPTLGNIFIDLPKETKLGGMPEFKDFKSQLPAGLQQLISRYNGERWLPERWAEIEGIRNSLIEKAKNEELWSTLAENFWVFYRHLEHVQHNATFCGKYAKPFRLVKPLTDYLVSFSNSEIHRLTWFWRQLPEKPFMDTRVLSAIKQNGNIDLIGESLDSALYRNAHLTTELALHDPVNLSNSILIGNPASIEYVQALVRHPDADLLKDKKVVDAIRASPFPIGLVYLAEHIGSAEKLMEVKKFRLRGKSTINGILAFFPNSVDEKTLAGAEYSFVGGCGGGIKRQDIVQKIGYINNESTIALFPSKAEFEKLRGQYFSTSYIDGCLGFANFIEGEDNIIITRNKSVWSPPTRLDQLVRLWVSFHRGKTDLDLSDEFKERFLQTPEIIWWAIHEYAKENNKSWIGMFPSSYWIAQSEATRGAREAEAIGVIKINRNENKYRKDDWQTVYNHTKANVLSNQTADAHYDSLAQRVNDSRLVPYVHEGREMMIWRVPVQQKTPPQSKN